MSIREHTNPTYETIDDFYPKIINDKYELTDEIIRWKGKNLYRIRALKDIVPFSVRKGDLGGFVESMDNLDIKGSCWIYDNAKVYGRGKVFGNATIHDEVEVYNLAKVYGNCIISNNCKIYGGARISGNITLVGNCKIHSNAVMSGKGYFKDICRTR